MDSPIILLAVLAVLLIPLFMQKRRADKLARSLKGLHEALTPGLPVVTTAGLHAKVVSVDELENTVDLEIARGVVCTFDMSAVIKVVGSKKLGADGLADIDSPKHTPPAANPEA